jgi:hypothetical protein
VKQIKIMQCIYDELDQTSPRLMNCWEIYIQFLIMCFVLVIHYISGNAMNYILSGWKTLQCAEIIMILNTKAITMSWILIGKHITLWMQQNNYESNVRYY